MGQQEDDFKKGEGDAWYERTLALREYSAEPNPKELALLASLPPDLRNSPDTSRVHLVEIGCSRGDSLSRIQRKTGFRASGIDPSQVAIAEGKAMFGDRLNLSFGTATQTGLSNSSVDVLFFGWCMTYVETDQFSRVEEEIDRVLKRGGVLAIFDFDYFGEGEHLTPYKHLDGRYCYRRNYTSIFLQKGFSLISKTPFVSEGEVIEFSGIPSERLALQVFTRS